MSVACKKCGTEFATGLEVGTHARDEHPARAKQPKQEWYPYVCYSCPGLFYTAQELVAHRGEHHAEGASNETFWTYFNRKWPDMRFCNTLIRLGAHAEIIHNVMLLKVE